MKSKKQGMSCPGTSINTDERQILIMNQAVLSTPALAVTQLNTMANVFRLENDIYRRQNKCTCQYTSDGIFRLGNCFKCTEQTKKRITAEIIAKL
jgi:hypothetical protein